MELNWNISKNKEILSQYKDLSIKRLPQQIVRNSLTRKCIYRTNNKCMYESRNNSGTILYEVFINFVVPIPIQFWPMSYYEYEEKYPDENEFNYRAWLFGDKQKAFNKYLIL